MTDPNPALPAPPPATTPAPPASPAPPPATTPTLITSPVTAPTPAPVPTSTPTPIPSPAPVPVPKASADDVDKKRPSERIDALEKETASIRFENSVYREAAKQGAKDPDYFNFLAQRARQEQGDAFNVTQFGAGLKTDRPDLFSSSVAQPATTMAGNPPAQTGTTKEQLQQKLDAAAKNKDVDEMLRLKSAIAAL